MPTIHLTLLYIVWFLLTFFFMLTILIFLKNHRDFYISPSNICKKLPKVAILVPAYNEGHCIADTINSCLKVNYPPELFEVIVINDGSKDNTGDIAKEFAQKGVITYIENNPNQGKSVALNRGFEATDAKFVATIDADTVVESDIIYKTLPYFSKDNIAAVTVSIKVRDVQNLAQKIVAIEYELGNGFYNKLLTYINCLFVTPGQFSIYRRDIVLELGGFDPHNIVEDTEIAYRMHKKGYKISCCAEAKAYTIVPKTIRDLYYQRKRWYTGTMQTILQHNDVIFNRKLGAFGMYFVPFNYGGTILATMLSLSLVLIILKNLFLTFTNMTLIGFDIFPFLTLKVTEDTLDPLALSMFLLLGLTPLVLHVISAIIGLKKMGNRLRDNIPGFIGFIFFFIPYQIMWLLCMYFTAFKKEVKWRAGM